MPNTSKIMRRTSRLQRLVLVTGLAGLLLASGLGVLYWYWTQPSRVRKLVLDRLESIIDAKITIDEARFSLFGGIELDGVRIEEVLKDSDASLPNHAPDRPGRILFVCDNVRAAHQPLNLLTGRLVINEFIAVAPTLTVLRDAERGTFNLERLFKTAPKPMPRSINKLPRIVLTDARIRLGRRTAEGVRMVEDLSLDVEATPQPVGRAYEVAWRAQGYEPSTGSLMVNLDAGSFVSLAGGLPWVTMEGVFLIADAKVPDSSDWCRLLGITGQLRIRDYEIGSVPAKEGQAQATIELRDASMSLPLDDSDRTTPPAQRYLRFNDVQGTLELSTTGATAHVEGVLHGSHCRIDAALTRHASESLTMGEVGFDVHLSAKNWHLPRQDDPDHPGESRFVNRWKKIRNFYRDYDPHGLVDLDASISKRIGSSELVKLDQFKLTAIDCDASYRLFPYRVENLTGQVSFQPGGLRLENLKGDHGTGQVVVNGTLAEPRWYTAAQLDFTGTNISIDRALHDALAQRHQDVWDQLHLGGAADIKVSMRREQGSPDQTEPWHTLIDAQFSRLSARLEAFDYPLDGLTGDIRIDGPSIEITRLSGPHGSGTITLDGSASLNPGRAAELDLNVEAQHVALDQQLLSALPSSVARQIERFNAAGYFNLSGSFSLHPERVGLSYDLNFALDGAAFQLPELPVPIADVHGKLGITPSGITLETVTGRWRSTSVTIDGQIDRNKETAEYSIRVACSGLRLDEELRAYLPVELRSALEPFQVDGPLQVASEHVVVGSRLDRTATQQTIIKAKDVSFRYEGFPLPLTRVEAEIFVKGSRIQIERFEGLAGDGKVELTGSLTLDPQGVQAEFEIAAQDISLDDRLRNALPWRLRRTWNNMKPTGQIDLRLSSLSLCSSDSADAEWSFVGQADLRNVAMEAGAKLTDVYASMDGRGYLSSATKGLSFALSVEADQLDLDGRRITDFSGQLSRSGATGLLQLEDSSGMLYGGSIQGSVELLAARTPAQFDAQVTLKDVSLHDLINSTKPSGAASSIASGRVDARLFWMGAVGDPTQTEGGGHVQVYEAELFELPAYLKIVSLLDLKPPENRPAQEGAARFTWNSSEVKFRQIRLSDSAVALRGTGRLLRSPLSMNLRLIATSPNNWLKVPVLTDMVEEAAGQLVDIHVSGSPWNPSVDVAPLRRLTAPLRSLFGPKTVESEPPPQAPAGDDN